MAASYYRRYLRSRLWSHTRRRALAHAGYQCAKCGRTQGLQVHHLTYRRLGHERLTDLVVLCPRCHRLMHWKGKRMASMIKLGVLWKRTTKEGKTYLGGKLGDAKLLIFANKDKGQRESAPDYIVYVSEEKTTEEKGEG